MDVNGVNFSEKYSNSHGVVMGGYCEGWEVWASQQEDGRWSAEVGAYKLTEEWAKVLTECQKISDMPFAMPSNTLPGIKDADQATLALWLQMAKISLEQHVQQTFALHIERCKLDAQRSAKTWTSGFRWGAAGVSLVFVIVSFATGNARPRTTG